MTMVYGLMVTRNEQDRWLEEMLHHSNMVVDHMFVFDDASEDETAAICEHYGASVVVRQPGEPSFARNEGQFRQCAWNHFRESCDPQEGEWVFALDADEFPICPVSVWPRLGVEASINKALRDNAIACDIEFKEVWELDPVRYRTDGFWDTIHHPRLFAYQDSAEWNGKRLGGGSWPQYVSEAKATEVLDLVVLHYGYARAGDREAKYQRYSELAGSHNNKHIASILGKPTLVGWVGPVPEAG
jgi:hypothetical protein